MVGTFLCGPEALAEVLEKKCAKYSDVDPRKTKFYFNKENFWAEKQLFFLSPRTNWSYEKGCQTMWVSSWVCFITLIKCCCFSTAQEPTFFKTMTRGLIFHYDSWLKYDKLHLYTHYHLTLRFLMKPLMIRYLKIIWKNLTVTETSGHQGFT